MFANETANKSENEDQSLEKSTLDPSQGNSNSFKVGTKNSKKIMDVLSGGLVVDFKSYEHLSEKQTKKWVTECLGFAEAFEVNKGYWGSGIASGSTCSQSDKMTAFLTPELKATYESKEKGLSKNRNFLLEITIEGDIPDRKKESGILESVVEETVSFWSGIISQVFQVESNEKRTIRFQLLYIQGGSKILFSERVYPYNEKFMSYFEIAGFKEFLAWDIVVEAPFQWVKESAEMTDVSLVPGIQDEKLSVKVVREVTTLPLNKNLFVVSAETLGSRLFVHYSDPLSAENHTKLLSGITEGELTSKFIVLEADPIPESKNFFLSVGYEPYTRYYTHKKFSYLLRKLEVLDLTFFFSGTNFGVSQLLVNNDEASYVGLKHARSTSAETEILGTYYNVDVSINKGVTKGLVGSYDLWPLESTKSNEASLSLDASRLRFGYRLSFLLPFAGAVDVTPTFSLWSFNATGTLGEDEDSISTSNLPALGIGAGYSLNLFDFSIAGFLRYSSSLSSDQKLTSLEMGGDLGYKLSNVYSMSDFHPTVFGFISNQSITIQSPSNEILRRFKGSGIVVGAGFKLIWE